MSEDRIPAALQAAAILISIGVISGTFLTIARKNGGTVPGMIARTLKWVARWITNLAIQYDAFLKNWREHVKKNPIVMQCEVAPEKEVTNVRRFKKAQ